MTIHNEGFVCAQPHPNAQPGLRFHAWRWSQRKILTEAHNLEFQVTGEQLRIWTKVRDVDTTVLKDLILGSATVSGKADLRKLGLDRFFETPKPVSLLKLLIGLTTGEGDTVLDFFAGSASTAQAVMEQNNEDERHRRYIMIQQPEVLQRRADEAECPFRTIAQLGQEHIRRVAGALSGKTDHRSNPDLEETWVESKAFIAATVSIASTAVRLK